MADAAGGVQLRAVGLRFGRSGRPILGGVDLTARRGQAIAVVGPSGSGKSTLLAILAGLEQPDAGSVFRAPGRVSLILQAYGLVSLLTAAENVEVLLQGSSPRGTGRRGIRDAAAAALAAVGLAQQADRLVEDLSGGQQQRLAIARALVSEPDLLIADEFTAELDPIMKDRVLDLVLGVARRGGTVVVATHDPDIAARCDVVVTLRDGRAIPAAR